MDLQHDPFAILGHLSPTDSWVNYPYGANLEDTRMKLEYDLYYIKFYSLYLDLVIVLRTVRVCLFGVGGR